MVRFIKYVFCLSVIVVFLCSCSRIEMLPEEKSVETQKTKDENYKITEDKGKQDFGSAILLNVNGEKVSLMQFNQDYRYYLSQNPNIKDSMEVKDEFFKKYKREIVVSQYAKDLKLDKDETFKARLENAERKLLVEYYTEVMMKEIQITEVELRGYYIQHIEEFTVPEMIKVSIITNNSIEAIKEAKKRLDEGEKFDVVAREFSIHPSKEIGGEINEYFKRGDKNRKFEDVSFSLNVSEISNIVQIDSVYYIIKVVGKKDREQKPFSEVKDEIRKKVLDEKIKNNIDKLISNSLIVTNKSLLK